VLVAINKHINHFVSSRLQFDVKGVESLAHIDVAATNLIQTNVDSRVQFILGSPTYTLKGVALAEAMALMRSLIFYLIIFRIFAWR
jgi:isocitrate lyase